MILTGGKTEWTLSFPNPRSTRNSFDPISPQLPTELGTQCRRSDSISNLNRDQSSGLVPEVQTDGLLVRKPFACVPAGRFLPISVGDPVDRVRRTLRNLIDVAVQP